MNDLYVLQIKNVYIHIERGKFLALDLGGTNFRVLIIYLDDNHHFDMQSKIYAIPQSIMVGTGQQVLIFS